MHFTSISNSPYLEPGIYKITCDNCNCFYIGQTGRNFLTRYREHVRISENNQSSFYLHLRNENHSALNIENALTILHKIPKGIEMNILEEFEIYIHTKNYPNEILNEHTDFKHKNYLVNFIDFIDEKG